MGDDTPRQQKRRDARSRERERERAAFYHLSALTRRRQNDEGPPKWPRASGGIARRLRRYLKNRPRSHSVAGASSRHPLLSPPLLDWPSRKSGVAGKATDWPWGEACVVTRVSRPDAPYVGRKLHLRVFWRTRGTRACKLSSSRGESREERTTSPLSRRRANRSYGKERERERTVISMTSR